MSKILTVSDVTNRETLISFVNQPKNSKCPFGEKVESPHVTGWRFNRNVLTMKKTLELVIAPNKGFNRCSPFQIAGTATFADNLEELPMNDYNPNDFKK